MGQSSKGNRLRSRQSIAAPENGLHRDPDLELQLPVCPSISFQVNVCTSPRGEMAKIVLAGRSDCPYFARCERLGDRLAKNLQKFKLHKIIIQPHEWEKWLKDTCAERGWSFNKSPIIWRELIDRGGKGVLIGDANDFQEYVKAYYDVEVEMDSSDMLMIATENKTTKDITDEEELSYKALSHPINICVTNAASPICYHLLNSLTSGHVFSKDNEVTVRLLVTLAKDIDKVKGYAMEAEDLAHGILKDIIVCTSPHEAFEDCSVVIILDSINKLTSETYKEWLERNSAFFGRYALIINHKALRNCKILLCGSGPLNIIAMEMAKNSPGISKQNIMALATVIENQAKSVIGERLGVNPADVVNLIVWGNIKEHQLLDLDHCRTYRYKSSVVGPPWYSVPTKDAFHDKRFIESELPKLVASRHHKVSGAMGAPPSLSIAAAIFTVLKNWEEGCQADHIFSLVVCSEGWYGVPRGLFFSFPVRLKPKGCWSIVPDLNISKRTKECIDTAAREIKSHMRLLHDGIVSPAPSIQVVGSILSLPAGSMMPPVK